MSNFKGIAKLTQKGMENSHKPIMFKKYNKMILTRLIEEIISQHTHISMLYTIIVTHLKLICHLHFT